MLVMNKVAENRMMQQGPDACDGGLLQEAVPQQLSLENQLLGLQSVQNARQLGGYRIGGKTVKRDVLLRSGALSKLSREEAEVLHDRFHVVQVYDFRSDAERQAAPDVLPEGAGYAEFGTSLSDIRLPDTVKLKDVRSIVRYLLENADAPWLREICAQLYDKVLLEETHQQVYRRFFEHLAGLPDDAGAVLWHCTQGKDRAGCASALLLAVLGAGRDLIVQDFALSTVFYAPQAAQLPVRTVEQQNVVQTLFSANTRLFEATLDTIDRLYGSMDAYLSQCLGVTEAMKQVLRERYLE